MSDQQIGRKMVEQIELEPFLEAYEWVTGDKLIIVESDENPDFICERPDGSKVGVELSKITRDKRDIFWERVLERKYEIEPYEAAAYINQFIDRKESARKARYISKVSTNMLALQLVDGTLENIMCVIEGLQDDFIDHGFAEIWLADYSGHEAYGDIELFGLYPNRWWGYHPRPWPNRKPFG